ncbi:AcvB/VirJ family lysyl-phosphatidylglycerol hydrolase, partial [Niveispirillum sp.]|uniref:virulence factor family protein n=1 Tax=Niveispirillum sp. TaxID=1917217 RepID=UPI001B410F00
MKMRSLFLFALVAGLAGLSVPAWWAHRYDIAPPRVKLPPNDLLGPVRVMEGKGGGQGPVVVLFTGPEGWDARADHLARRLVHGGSNVIGLDLKAVRDGIAKADGDCVDPSWAVQDISHAAQRSLGLSHYNLPILAGIGAGADMAVAIAGTGTPAILGGVVAVDEGKQPPPRPLCTNPQSQDVPVTRPTGGGRPGERLIAELARRAQAQGDTELSDLPLTELPADARHGVLAIVYSGDGGWRDLDKDIAERLQSQGVPTVGVDMLRYYWAWRSPEDSAIDLSRLITHYRREWGIDKVVLIGYSFGADVMPALYNLLPADQRQSVVQISLLALSARANFEVTVGEILTANSESTQPTRPDLDRIDPKILQCFDGKEDEDGVCETLKGTGIELVETEGGHHFDGDYEHLADITLAGIDRRVKG